MQVQDGMNILEQACNAKMYRPLFPPTIKPAETYRDVLGLDLDVYSPRIGRHGAGPSDHIIGYCVSPERRCR